MTRISIAIITIVSLLYGQCLQGMEPAVWAAGKGSAGSRACLAPVCVGSLLGDALDVKLPAQLANALEQETLSWENIETLCDDQTKGLALLEYLTQTDRWRLLAKIANAGFACSPLAREFIKQKEQRRVVTGDSTPGTFSRVIPDLPRDPENPKHLQPAPSSLRPLPIGAAPRTFSPWSGLKRTIHQLLDQLGVFSSGTQTNGLVLLLMVPVLRWAVWIAIPVLIAVLFVRLYRCIYGYFLCLPLHELIKEYMVEKGFTLELASFCSRPPAELMTSFVSVLKKYPYSIVGLFYCAGYGFTKTTRDTTRYILYYLSERTHGLVYTPHIVRKLLKFAYGKFSHDEAGLMSLENIAGALLPYDKLEQIFAHSTRKNDRYWAILPLLRKRVRDGWISVIRKYWKREESFSELKRMLFFGENLSLWLGVEHQDFLSCLFRDSRKTPSAEILGKKLHTGTIRERTLAATMLLQLEPGSDLLENYVGAFAKHIDFDDPLYPEMLTKITEGEYCWDYYMPDNTHTELLRELLEIEALFFPEELRTSYTKILAGLIIQSTISRYRQNREGSDCDTKTLSDRLADFIKNGNQADQLPALLALSLLNPSKLQELVANQTIPLELANMVRLLLHAKDSECWPAGSIWGLSNKGSYKHGWRAKKNLCHPHRVIPDLIRDPVRNIRVTLYAPLKREES